MILKNSSTEYLLGEIYCNLSMNGLTAAELDSPPLKRWKTIISRVPVYLAASEFLNKTPHQYPMIHPIRFTSMQQNTKPKKYSK